MKKPLTAKIKSKKKKYTKYDLEKLHDRWLDLIDRFGRVHTLPEALKLFWEIWQKSEVCIKEQIILLRQKTGEMWNHSRYYRTRKNLFDHLKD